MNERIKEIRKSLNMTQQEFADKIGVSRNNIAGYETGKRCPSDAVVSLICEKCMINEEWLRYGSGSMLSNLNRKDQILLFAKRLMQNESEEFVDRFTSAISKLDVEDWEILADLAESLAKRKEKG